MHLFGWLDLRTLVACQVPLAAVIALAHFALNRVYPHLRGVSSIAIAFALWIPATALVVAQGVVPSFVSIIGGNLLAVGCYILLYRGVLAFFGAKGHVPLLYDIASVATAVMLYFTVIHDLFAPRIVALSVVAALARGLIAIELLGKAKSRVSVLAFAGFLGLFTILPVSVALLSLFHGSLSINGLEGFNTLADLVFLSGCGLFTLFLFLKEANESTRQRGQFDFLTGTLNRSAIEEALSVEIARSSRTHSPVSVMLVEVDHYSTLTAIHGNLRAEQTLCTVVSTFGGMLRFYDKCGRISEDRFLVLLPENVAEHAMVIAARFREALKSPSLPHDQPAVTLSIGVTQSTLKEVTADVLARAEAALLQARSNGRDCAHLAYDNRQQLPTGQPGPVDRLATRSRVAAKASR